MSLGRRAERERIVRRGHGVKRLSSYWPASCQRRGGAPQQADLTAWNHVATCPGWAPVGRLQNLAFGARRRALGRLRIAHGRVARLGAARPARRSGGRRGRRRRGRLVAGGGWIREVELVARVEHLLKLGERELGLVPPFVLNAETLEHQEVLLVRADRLLEQDADLLPQLLIVDLALLGVGVAHQLGRDRRVDERVIELLVQRSDLVPGR